MTLDIVDGWFTGCDYSLTVTVLGKSGSPVHLAGLSLSWLVKLRATDRDVDALVERTTANGGLMILDPGGGVVQITVPATLTATVPPRVYHHELARTNVGSRHVYVSGLCALRRALHQAV